MDKKDLNSCDCGGEHEHNCSCGCEKQEPIIVELEDEKGNVVKCEVVEGFVCKEQEYALVQNPNDESVYLFKVVGEEEDQGELVVPDDDEFKEATAYYEKLLESEK